MSNGAAQEKSTNYGPGGWRSRKRQASRPDVVRAVQMAARGGKGEDAPVVAGDAALLAHYVAPLGGSFKANYGKDGRWWYKIAWKAAGNPVYLASSYDASVTCYGALVDLCEQLEEVKRGLRKPSPDRFASGA